MGLVPSRKLSYGALDLGTWVHDALAKWYCPGYKRCGPLADIFDTIAGYAIQIAGDIPDFQMEKADELFALGKEMCIAYEAYWNRDHDWYIIEKEIPLEFVFPSGTVFKLKPDVLYQDRYTREIFLGEHKTAGQIRTDHLPIDGQARPYGVLAERALKKAGILGKGQQLNGIMYNFLRKALPDDRPQNEKGLYLNKNGSISAKQPKPTFQRHPVQLTIAAKRRTLERLAHDVRVLDGLTERLKSGEIDRQMLWKTSDKSCPKICDYFDMCKIEEDGNDIRYIQRDSFRVEDPYIYAEEMNSANEYREGFEIA